MPFIVKALIILPVFYFFAGGNFHRLWKGGLIGVGVALAADFVGYKLSLYRYLEGQLLFNIYPFFHLINMFIFAMLFLNWLPREWTKRILYTVYVSVIFLAIEAMMFQANAIVYLHWELWHSYFLDIGGLLLLAYLNDLITKKTAVWG
ncbi:MAG: hypothetical protein JL50_05220 [Peptococcaceae bacterium BICA1-7]|nr:MAG: hypothetical protein JL50_05220 [Peptococcaceae bacterium BICA1-7]HBV96016.1 hypothetical protein [Desulfotomaculum sp.]